MRVFETTVIVLSALAMFYASATRLGDPARAVFLRAHAEYSAAPVKPSTDLWNEIRGVGGVLLMGGILALIGSFTPSVRKYSFLIGSVVFIGITIGRILSIGIDGVPSTAVARVMVVEFVLAVLNTYFSMKIFNKIDTSP